VQPGRVQTKNGLRRVIKSIAEVRKDRDVMIADEIFSFRTQVDPEDGLVIGGEHVCVILSHFCYFGKAQHRFLRCGTEFFWAK